MSCLSAVWVVIYAYVFVHHLRELLKYALHNR